PRLPGAFKVVANDPFGFICIAGALEGRGGSNPSLVPQLEEDRKWDCLVNALQYVALQLPRFEGYAEKLDLRNRRRSLEVYGFRSKFELPCDLFHLADKQIFDGRARACMLIYFALGQNASEGSTLWIVEKHGRHPSS